MSTSVERVAASNLRIERVEEVVFSAVFTALAVFLPWVAHQFHLAGPRFLPMHLFVFVAALFLGWRSGLVVALLSPTLSYLLSGMPLVKLVPQITVELLAYGVAAGILAKQFRLNIFLSLLGAMVAGRIGLFLAVWAFQTSPAGPFQSVKSAVVLGWPGILIQLAIVPLVVFLLTRFFERRPTQE